MLASTSRRREFETSTTPDVPLDYADKNSQTTTGIEVQWSYNAIQASQKKRKRADDEGGKTTGGDTTPKKKQLGDAASSTKSGITAIFCVLRKQQCEHQVAIQTLARALRCRSGDIGLAGIKDMQAVTYQFCTLRNVTMSKAQHVAHHSLGKRVQLSNFVETQNVLLDRGSLLGNRFEITLRNLKRIQRMHKIKGEDGCWKEQTIPLHSSHLDAMVKRIGDYGFINFFGEQRVGDAGSRSYAGVRSFDVGRAMLQGNFALAIDLIMTGRSNQVHNAGEEEMNARKVWKTSGKDPRATLKAFPKNNSTMVRERDLIKGLLRYGDALEAIRCVPHNVRMFWIHGYQSFIWNRMATERIKRWGLRPVKGDLYLKEHESNGDDKDVTTAKVQVVDDPSSVDIFDIVLPLPGYNIQYPSNEVGELYRERLRKDSLDISKNKIAEATAKGGYRKLIQRASQTKWDNLSEDWKEDSSEDQLVTAAKITFELKSGCYATMLLRELMVTTMVRGDNAKR